MIGEGFTNLLLYYLAVWQPIRDMPRPLSVITWAILTYFVIKRTRKTEICERGIPIASAYAFFWLLFYLASFDWVYNTIATIYFKVYTLERFLWQILLWVYMSLGLSVSSHEMNFNFKTKGIYLIYAIYWVITALFLSPYFLEWGVACNELPLGVYMWIIYAHNWLGRSMQIIGGYFLLKRKEP